MGDSYSSWSYRIYTKHILCIEESMHVNFDDSNYIVENKDYEDE